LKKHLAAGGMRITDILAPSKTVAGLSDRQRKEPSAA